MRRGRGTDQPAHSVERALNGTALTVAFVTLSVLVVWLLLIYYGA
jgi:hypothetical protein